MPTEELKQALRGANVVGVDKDFVDLLCKLFDAPRPLVLRILYATQYASAEFVGHQHWMNPDELSRDLREAIGKRVKESWRRIQVMETLKSGGVALVWVDALVPRDKPERICRGCPKSLDCVAESLSTPAECREGEGPIPKKFDAKPIKIVGDKVTVECAWPEGTYVVDVADFDM